MKKLRAALVISLGFNLLLAAFVAVHMVRLHGHMHDPEGHGAAAMLDHLAGGMAPPDAAVLRQSLAAHQADITQAQQAIGTDMDAVRTALVAEPLDRARLQAAMTAAHDARQRLTQQVEAVILAAAPALSMPARQHLASLHGGR